jgi:outer membrane protein assembly factor BamB
MKREAKGDLRENHMSNNQEGHLGNEEWNFLMKDTGSQNPDELQGQGYQATLNGDLSQVSLPDIFQTISMSQMDGTLRVTSRQAESTHLLFQEGVIKVLPPFEEWFQRFCNRLVASGLTELKLVRKGILNWKKEGGDPLVSVCTATGISQEDEISIREALDEDCLFELFALRAGSFAFYRGSLPPGNIAERAEGATPFPIDQCLLEVARKSDEWDIILDSLGDFDEIFSKASEPEEDLPELHSLIYEACDGKKSLRELAGSMLDTVFDVAKAAQELYEKGLIEKTCLPDLVDLAEEAIELGKSSLARNALQLGMESRETMDASLLNHASQLFVRLGAPKEAATILVRCASLLNDPEQQLKFLKKARKLDPRNLEVLQELLHKPQASNPDEQIDVAIGLVEEYMNRGDGDEAVRVLEDLRKKSPNNLNLSIQLAAALHHMDRVEDAVAELTELADTFRLTNDREDLMVVLNQILKLRPSLHKVRDELRSLQGKGKWTLRRITIAATVLIALSTGGLTIKNILQERDGKEKLQTANAMMDKGDLGTAEAIANRLIEDFEDGPVGGRARDLINRIRSRRAAELRTKREELQKRFHRGLSLTADLFEKGAIAESLLEYKKLYKSFGNDPSFRKRIQDSLKTRLGEFKSELEKEEEKAKARELPDPKKYLNLEEKEAALKRIQNSFSEKRAENVRKLQDALKKSPSLASLKGFPEGLTPLLGKWLEAEKRVSHLRGIFRKKIGLDTKKRALDRPFLMAQEAEKQKKFKEALRLYRKLAKEYQGDQSLMAFFQRQASKYDRITSVLAQIETARKREDFRTGSQLFQELAIEFPQVSLRDRILLPYRIETSPVSVEVFVNGKMKGRTPMTLSLHPGEESKLLLRKNGYEEVSPSKALMNEGRVRSILTLLPSWKTKVGGALTQSPLFMGGKIFVSDRSGGVSILDPKSGKKLKEIRFKDPTGNLGAPTQLGGGILLISRDGPVRKLNLDGSLVWETQLKGPLLLGAGIWAKRLMIFSEEGVETILDPRTGEVIFTQKGRKKRVGPFQARKGDPVIIVGRNGWVQALSSDGGELWGTQIEEAGYARPFVHGKWVLVPSDDMGLHALNIQTGEKQWRVRLGDGLRGQVHFGCDGENIFVATRNRELFKIALKTGKNLGMVPMHGLPSGRVALIEGFLFVSLSGRGPEVCDPKSLKHIAWLGGEKGSEATVVQGEKGQALVCRSTGTVASFPLSLLR